MEYLWFDTDVRNIDIAHKELDVLDRKVDFTVQERVDGRVRPRELDAYRTQKNAYPYIWSWFPQELDSLASDAIMQGAGQIRPCGRLALRIETGIPTRTAGAIVLGCSTLAPNDASSLASSNRMRRMSRASGTTRGSAVSMPSTSVQISIASAPSAAPNNEAV